MTPTDAIFGRITGTPQVEFAVLNTLEAWVPFHLRVLERRLDVPRGTLIKPPGRSSYIGGIDFDCWDGDCLPNIVAVVKPTGEADRSTNGYSQWFELEVTPVVVTETEDESRVLAGHLGTAIVLALTQHGDLGGIAAATDLISMPAPEFPDPEKRRLVRAPATFHAYIEGLVDPLAGPKSDTPPESPQYPGDPDAPFGDWPAHTETNVDVDVVRSID